MDIRIEKTEKAIKNAFIELRSKKALEKISVKELCELACINKSTFYSHYEDIYALSDALENETVASIISSLSHNLEYSSNNPELFTKDLSLAFVAHMSIINILFSGKENSCLASKLEVAIKQAIYIKNPHYENDIEKNILLSYCIQGAYHAHLNNQSVDEDMMIQTLEKIVKTLQPLF